MYLLRDVLNTYLAEVTPTKAVSTQRHDHLYARRLELLSSVPIADLAPRHVHALHRTLADTPVLANRIKSLLSQVCDLAERSGLRPASSNPTRAVRNYSERRRTEFLAPTQRAAFLRATRECVARGEVTVSAGCVCTLLLLAGLRLREATGLLWSEVDLERGLIRLAPRAKRGANKRDEDRSRPITDDVVAVLRSMPRWSAWVAPNPETRQPYVDLRCAMRAICDRAGLAPKLTRHALRHSFGTALAEAGLTAEQIAPWMGHSSASSSQVYVHLTAPSLRRHADVAARAVRGEGEP